MEVNCVRSPVDIQAGDFIFLLKHNFYNNENKLYFFL